MNQEARKYTFESLTQMSKKELDRLMFEGSTPQPDEILGEEYKGWNINPTTKIIGTRKFKKGFFGERGQPYIWGYNVRVEQNKKDQPWKAKPNDENPKRFAFFKVYTAASVGHNKYPNSLIIHYAKWGEYFFLNPVKYTVDYCILPDPQNPDLIVGKSYFEAGPLKFFMGYFILEKYNDSNYRRTSHFLSLRELRTVEKFSEVFIEGQTEAIPPREITWNIDRQLEHMQSNRKWLIRVTLFLIEYILPFPRFFSRLSAAKRKELIVQKLEKPRKKGILGKMARDISRCRQIFLAGYYMDSRVHQAIHFVPVPEREQFKGKPLQRPGQKHLALFEPQTAVIDTDVCVIGSGAGGAVVAYHAAAAGRETILLEEGDYMRPDDLEHDEAEMVGRMYKEGGLQSTVDYDLTILQGKTLGGTTVINNAICFRLNDSALTNGAGPGVLERWRALGADIDEKQLDLAFDRVEKMLQVAPLPQEIAGTNAGVLLNGWKKLAKSYPANGAIKYGLLKKNYRNCAGCGYCNFGCPYGRKSSMLETYIPAAVEHGAKVVVGCHAVKIERAGRQVVGVRCEMAGGRKIFVHAKKIVLACGAIGSSVLLMKSGISKNVGTRFSFNAGTPMFARFNKVMNGFDGVQMGAYLNAQEFILESLFNPPMSFALSLPGWFEQHFHRMQDYNKFACIGVLIGTEANGRVKRRSTFRKLFGPVAYEMTRQDLEKLKKGMQLAADIMFAAGAEAVYPATFEDIELTSPELAGATIANKIGKPDDITLGSSHPQGGNPMSDDRGIGVVDSRFQVHGVDNLYVCDASVFPETVGINPQLTIMALADYFWHLGDL